MQRTRLTQREIDALGPERRLPPGEWLVDTKIDIGRGIRGNGAAIFFVASGGFTANKQRGRCRIERVEFIVETERYEPVLHADGVVLSLTDTKIRWRGPRDFALRAGPAVVLRSGELHMTRVVVDGWPGPLGHGACVDVESLGGLVSAQVCLFAPWKSSALAARGCREVQLSHCTFAMNAPLAATAFVAAPHQHTNLHVLASEIAGDVSGALLGLSPASQFNLKLDGCLLGELDVIERMATTTREERALMLKAEADADISIDGRPMFEHLAATMGPVRVFRHRLARASELDTAVGGGASLDAPLWGDAETLAASSLDAFGRPWGASAPIGALSRRRNG